MKISTIIKCLGGTLMLLTPFVKATGKQLSPNQALERALANSKTQRVASAGRLSLSYTESIEEKNLVYVFNDSKEGFIIVGGDDNMSPILGYSDNGTFDYASAPPALKWWLEQYAKEASTLLSQNITVLQDIEPRAKKTSAQKEAIPYLIQTVWGQTYPFNLDCPEIGDDKCVTGCVATAMAQILKYHGYPTKGRYSNRYNWNGQELEFDYENTTFNFDEMKDSYYSLSSEEEMNAVANLMSACGIAVDMQYNLEGSSASDTYIAYALTHFFNYDTNTRYLKRDFFSDEDWEDLIYTELQQKRPVIYGGQAPQGGHQFICDGYDGNGFFHINWGWAKLADGYYRLSALEPYIQGTGGFEGGYNSDQAIVCGIQPELDGSPVWYPIYSTGSLKPTEISSTAINLVIEAGGIYNYSQQPTEVELLLKLVSEEGKEYISEPRPFLVSADSEPTTWLPFPGAMGTSIGGYSSLPTMNLPQDLPAGEYKGSIVFRTQVGNLQQVYFPRTVTSYFNLTVGNGGNVSVTPGQPEARAEIRVTKFEPQSPVFFDTPTKFILSIENIGDITYNGWIEYKIFREGMQVNERPLVVTFNSVLPGEHPSYLLTLTLNYQVGIYDIIFFDQYGDQISEPFTISIGDSGVESIMTEHQHVDVYSMGGSLIKKNADLEDIMTLPKGIYIFNAGGKAYKVIR